MIDPTGHEVHGPDLNPPEEESRSPLSPTPEEQTPETEPNETVCDTCYQENILTNVGIIYCQECHTLFCTHYASKTDPAYCVSCLSDIAVANHRITYERTVYNALTDKETVYRRRAKEIKIEGSSWLFIQRKIYTLSEAELDAAIEVHRNTLNLMIQEKERLRNASIHRNAAVKVAIPTHSTVTKTVTSKETTKTSSTKAQAQLSSLLSSMLAKGISVDAIAALLKK